MEGRSEAWDELALRHTPRVRLVLLARGVPLELVEDVTQEAWVRLIEQQRSGRLRTLELPGLVIAQARWLALEARRTLARRSGLSAQVARALGDETSAGGGSDVEAHAMHAEQLERVRHALDAFPRRSREVFGAVYGPGGHSHAWVAETFGLSVQRVRQILCEIRARARSEMIAAEGEDGSWNT
jgi:RNA polymerase sigma-70 factor (ECF subfamily)